MIDTREPRLPFSKMHGAGNDFVVIDGRARAIEITADLARAMADRHKGVGFDQLALITHDPQADLRLTFWNADGSLSAACGNATRCIAARELDLTGAEALRIAVADGRTLLARREHGDTWVNMGPALTGWQDIPLSEAADTDALPLDGAPMATSMGNPHCTWFVDDLSRHDIETVGPETERHPLFPERTNVQLAQITGRDELTVHVWERGTGRTLASGSSSCAVAHAAHRSGRTGKQVALHLEGGTLRARVSGDGIWLTGPTATVFEAVWCG